MNKDWEALSSDEKSEEMLKSLMHPVDVEFASREAKKLYEERAKRIRDALRLEVPDRVPFWFADAGFFPVDMQAFPLKRQCMILKHVQKQT